MNTPTKDRYPEKNLQEHTLISRWETNHLKIRALNGVLAMPLYPKM